MRSENNAQYTNSCIHSARESCRTDCYYFDIPVRVEASIALRNWQQERCILLCWNSHRSLRPCGGLLFCVRFYRLFFAITNLIQSSTDEVTSFWGALSDRIGRKPVVLLGCLGTIVSLLSVGLATNFWTALIGRALGGALNGNMGVIQTMVGEMITNPKHERKWEVNSTDSWQRTDYS